MWWSSRTLWMLAEWRQRNACPPKNEYSSTVKADRILKMLAWLKDEKGLQIDGVGFQSHENINWPSVADLADEAIVPFAPLPGRKSPRAFVRVEAPFAWQYVGNAPGERTLLQQ